MSTFQDNYTEGGLRRFPIQNFITPNDPLVKSKAQELNYNFFNIIFYVGRLPYKSDKSSWPYASDYWQLPNETIRRGEGDCEDHAFLLSSLLLCSNYTARVVLGGVCNGGWGGHAWVEYWNWGESHWQYLEATGKDPRVWNWRKWSVDGWVVESGFYPNSSFADYYDLIFSSSIKKEINRLKYPIDINNLGISFNAVEDYDNNFEKQYFSKWIESPRIDEKRNKEVIYSIFIYGPQELGLKLLSDIKNKLNQTPNFIKGDFHSSLHTLERPASNYNLIEYKLLDTIPPIKHRIYFSSDPLPFEKTGNIMFEGVIFLSSDRFDDFDKTRLLNLFKIYSFLFISKKLFRLPIPFIMCINNESQIENLKLNLSQVIEQLNINSYIYDNEFYKIDFKAYKDILYKIMEDHVWIMQNVRVLMDQSNQFKQDGDYDKLIENLQKVLEMLPENPDIVNEISFKVWLNMGFGYYNKHKSTNDIEYIENAIICYENAREFDLKNIELITQLLELYKIKSKLEIPNDIVLSDKLKEREGDIKKLEKTILELEKDNSRLDDSIQNLKQEILEKDAKIEQIEQVDQRQINKITALKDKILGLKEKIIQNKKNETKDNLIQDKDLEIEQFLEEKSKLLLELDDKKKKIEKIESFIIELAVSSTDQLDFYKKFINSFKNIISIFDKNDNE